MLTVEDDERGGGPSGPAAVISHRFWQNRFGGADDVVGQRLVINGEPLTVVGVAPRSFFGLDVGRSFDVMLPFALKPILEGDPRALDQRSNWWVSIGARLAPGQTIEGAQAAASCREHVGVDDAVRPRPRADRTHTTATARPCGR